MSDLKHCKCLEDGNRNYRDFDSKALGTDAASDAEVTLKRCRRCNRLWLRYFIEGDAGWDVDSGRWAEGLIPEAVGEQAPEPVALSELSAALNLPVAYFLKPQMAHGDRPFFYRSMAAATKAARRKAKARLRGENVLRRARNV